MQDSAPLPAFRARPGRRAALVCITAAGFCAVFAATHWTECKVLLAMELENRAQAGRRTAFADLQATVANAMEGCELTPETELVVDTDKAGGYNLDTGAFIPYLAGAPADALLNDAQWQAGCGVDVIAYVPPELPTPLLFNFSLLSNVPADLAQPPWIAVPPSPPFAGILPSARPGDIYSGRFPPYSQPPFDYPIQDSQSQMPSLLDETDELDSHTPSITFIGGSAIELTGVSNDLCQFMVDFLQAHPATHDPFSWMVFLPGVSLDDLLSHSSLPKPIKGRFSNLPSGDPNMSFWGGGMQTEFTRTWLVRTLGGRVAILEVVNHPGDAHPLRIRWRFLQKVSKPEPVAPINPAEFRCLAWLDEVHAKPDWRAWAHNGELLNRGDLHLPDPPPAPSKEQIAKIDTAAGIPRYITFWFRCPGLDPLSVADARLLNASSRPQTYSRDPANALNITGTRPGQHDAGSGWIVSTLYAGRADQLPPWANVQLRYSTGPWQPWRDLPPYFSGRMAVIDGVYATRTGQGDDGRTYLEIIRDPAKEDEVDTSDYERHVKIDEQIDFMARTKDGRSLTRAAITSGTDQDGIITEHYLFDVPLTQVAAFQGRKRPVWHLTQDFTMLRGRPGD